MAPQPAEHPRRKWLIFVPVVLGIAILVVLAKNRTPPEQTPLAEQAHTVRVIKAPSVTVIPTALGYGNVEPSIVWEAVAEVSGKIVEMHPQLKKGAILVAGSILLKIDPADYELAVAQAETNIQATQAQLAQQEVEEANTRASLAIEQEALALREKELERKRKLMNQRTLPRSEFEQEQRSVLTQKQSVQSLHNTLNLYPVERNRLEAEQARYQAQLASARLDLERTAIGLPFTGRIAEVNVERTQYVRQGEELVVADGIDMAEVSAQIPMGRMRGLIRSDETVDPIRPGGTSLSDAFGISARVWLRGQGIEVDWDGRFARISDTLDPQTRTVGVIVEVDKPYGNIRPGVRPPLVKGMFVEVELRGRPRPDRLVIPRSALRGNGVYVANDDDRLEQRAVKVDLVQPSFVIITGGLRAGDRVIISDLIPAIDGMLLNPVVDEDALARLIRQAKAEE